jgi:hypothetical protein
MQDAHHNYTFTLEHDPDSIRRVRAKEKDYLMNEAPQVVRHPMSTEIGIKHLCNVCGKRFKARKLRTHWVMDCKG